ncbi:MAG: LCP family protein [Anaerolineae bacterium]
MTAAVTEATASPTPSRTPTAMPIDTVAPTPTDMVTPTPSPTPTEAVAAAASPSSVPAETAAIAAAASATPQDTPTPQFSPTPVATTEFTEDVVHILLIGGDRDYVLDMNTDTLIVMVINRTTKQVSLLSIPRDLWVYIPTYGWSRINVAHRIGQRGQYPDGKGPGLLARTIELNLGIPIDHWVRIGYSGFTNVVDELGGVEVVVPCPVNLRYKPPTSEVEQEIILQPGVHQLDGETALRYVRTRRGDTDFGRASRQQQFLKAIWDQFKSPNILLKVPGLWSALKDSFRTDLTLGDVLALAPIALDLDYQHIRSLYIGPNQVEGWVTPEGWSVLRPIPEKVQQVVARLYAPPAADDAQSDRAGRIQIWNGTSRPQLALIAADQLRWQGFQVTDTRPADRTDYAQTQIVILNDNPETVTALATALGVKQERIIQQPDPDQGVDIRVILGQAYDPCR